MRKQYVPGSFLSAHALEPGNETKTQTVAVIAECQSHFLMSLLGHIEKQEIGMKIKF